MESLHTPGAATAAASDAPEVAVAAIGQPVLERADQPIIHSDQGLLGLIMAGVGDRRLHVGICIANGLVGPSPVLLSLSLSPCR